MPAHASPNNNLVIIANIEWGYLKQRHQHLALNLCDTFNVVYVESTAKRNPTLQDIPRIAARLAGLFGKRKRHSAADTKGINIITPLVCPSTFAFFRLCNRLVFSRLLARQIRSRCTDNAKTILLTYLPSSTVFDIIRLLPHQALAYDCVSNFAGVEGMPPDTVLLEQQLIRQSDIVLTDCDFLLNKHRPLARRIELVEPGVDFALFSSIRSDVCRKIQKITYYGAITDKIDFDLLQYLLDRGIDITMIGPIRYHHKVLDSLRCLPPVPHRELPAQLVEADALIIPYRHNTFMLGVIPAKFFECFATGKPVITTYSDNYRRYEDLLLQGRTPEEIYRRMENLHREETEEKQHKRLEIAQAQDWRKLGTRICNFLESLL